jgi:hypothetical protein
MNGSSFFRSGAFAFASLGMVFATGCTVQVIANASVDGDGGGGAGGVVQGSSSSGSGSNQGGSGGVGASGGTSSVSSSGAGGNNQGGSNGESSASSSGAGGSGAGGSGGSLPSCNDGVDTVLAIDKLLLGETDPDGTPNYASGWKQYGFDLDGRVSTPASVDLCQPAAGAGPQMVYGDGNGGRDNSFGKNILPILYGLSNNISSGTNAAIHSGKFAYLLSIKGLLWSTSCATQSKLFGGKDLGAPAQFDGNDVWPLDPSYLSDPADPTSAKSVFLTSAVDQDVYRSGPDSGATFEIVIDAGNNIQIRLPIRHVRLEMKLTPDHDGAVAGQLGGIMDTEEFVQGIANMAREVDKSFCDPNSPTMQSILNQLRQASDIMNDGTQDPSKVCNGISVGLGFTMKSAQLGAVAPAEPPPVDPCTP